LVEKAKSLEELISDCPTNEVIGNNLVKAWAKVNSPNYNKAVCTISGGSDSDVMLDIIWRCDKDSKVEYVWFDTGLEYQATKDQLKVLEDKYGITITKYRAIKPIPATCKQYGQPFLSKYVSEMIQRLQRHNFKWEDRPFEELYKEYPKCKVSLQWWCNANGENSSFNISRNKWLKEFIVQNPPQFKVSNKCCQYAKKDVVHKLIKENEYELEITGIRKSEGGIRATQYKNCFDNNGNSYDRYRPLFWYTNADKEQYEEHYGVEHSKCYTEYGLKRTGCAGCPFGKDFEFELEVIEKHEPKLFKAVNNIFGDSYDYTRRYKAFWAEQKAKERSKE
jgi:3'-phosphoadenosine 5'-phosphosulfate sulfotransferase (PAPS reductase)/FAD synthetase